MMQAHGETTAAFDPLASIRSELEKLSMLSLCRQGLPVYYAALLTHKEEVLRVAAMSALLELSVLKPDQWDLAIQMSRYGAVKRRCREGQREGPHAQRPAADSLATHQRLPQLSAA